jgi:hypothetical protein
VLEVVYVVDVGDAGCVDDDVLVEDAPEVVVVRSELVTGTPVVPLVMVVVEVVVVVTGGKASAQTAGPDLRQAWTSWR